MLSPETIATIKATAPVLSQRGEELTRHFYRRMFAGNPEVRAFFNPAHQQEGTQQRALAGAICAFAYHVDNLEVLGPAVELIAQKHASLGVKREHYPIVGEHLLGSIREVLRIEATDPIIGAWAEAYGFLVEVLVGRESQLYDEHRARHGWEGFKPFVVDRKVPESDCITSFYLKPQDGQPLAAHAPGQYITVRIPTEDGSTTMRNYSLSSRPGEDFYRISVKREAAKVKGGVAGVVSNHFHDKLAERGGVEVGPPCGEFTLEIDAAGSERRPLVFLPAGVGVTPLLSMLHAAVDARLDRDVYFIQAAINGCTHAFRDEIAELAKRHRRVRPYVRYSQPTAEDKVPQRYDSEGFVTIELLQQLLPTLDCDYYLCGPKPFMVRLYAPLIQSGVSEDQVRLEFFGPKQEMTEEPSASAVELKNA